MWRPQPTICQAGDKIIVHPNFKSHIEQYLGSRT